MTRSRNRRLELVLEIQKHMVQQPTARLDELAVMADIAPITLYRYFGSREGLVRSIAEYIIDDFSIASDTIFKSRGDFEKSINFMVDFFLPRLDGVRFLFQLDSFVDSRSDMADIYKTVTEYRKEFSEYMYKLVQKGIKEKYIRRDVDAKWVTQTFVWMLFGVREIKLTSKVTSESVKKLLIQTLIEGNHKDISKTFIAR